MGLYALTFCHSYRLISLITDPLNPVNPFLDLFFLFDFSDFKKSIARKEYTYLTLLLNFASVERKRIWTVETF